MPLLRLDPFFEFASFSVKLLLTQNTENCSCATSAFVPSSNLATLILAITTPVLSFGWASFGSYPDGGRKSATSRTQPGPHKLRECMPLSILLRQRLKYALTYKEVKLICMQRVVKAPAQLAASCASCSARLPDYAI